MLSKEECKNTMLKMHNDGINLIIHKFSDDLNTLQDKLEIIKSNTNGLYHDPF